MTTNASAAAARRIRALLAGLVVCALLAAAPMLQPQRAEAASADTLDHVVSLAESTQGETLGELEKQWNPTGSWANFSADWCAWYVTYLLRNNGVAFTAKDFFVSDLWNTYVKAGRAHSLPYGAKPTVGALVFYGTGNAQSLTHVGLVVGVSKSGLPRTVEGNTGFSASHVGYYGDSTSYANSKVNTFMGPHDTVYGYAYPRYGAYDSLSSTGSTGTAIAQVTTTMSSHEVALTSSASDFWTVGSSRKDWRARVRPGSSPSIAAVSSGHETAFATNTDDLWSLGDAGSYDWEMTVAPNTSPSLTAYGSGYQIAFVGKDGTLISVGAAGTRKWGVAVRAGTSPAIAAVSGGYAIAYVTKGGDLRVVLSRDGSIKDWNRAVRSGTNPAITATPTGYEVTYVTSSGTVSTVGALGTQNWPVGVAAGSSTAVTAVTGGYVVAVRASGGTLMTSTVVFSTSGATRTTVKWGVAMMAGSSPSLAAGDGTGFTAAVRATSGNLVTATATAAGATRTVTWAAKLGAGTSPSITG